MSNTGLFAVCAICRNEFPYIMEWIAYQKSIGIDHIYLYDNVSDDGTSELLINLDAIGEITRVHWPRKKDIPPQREAYSHFLQNFSHLFEWVMICDIDEFFLPKQGNIKDFVLAAQKKVPDVAAIAIPWLMFGSSGLITQDDRLVLERFTACDEKPHSSVKSIFKPSKVFNMRTHICDILEGSYIDNEFALPKWNAEPISLEKPTFGYGIFHHYFTKSKEEWEKRRLMGRADRAQIVFRTLQLFDRYNFQSSVNVEIHRYLEQVKDGIKYLSYKFKLNQLKIKKIDENYTQLVSIDRRWIIGRINSQLNNIKVRILLNDEIEFVCIANKKFSDQSVGFILNTSWLNITIEKINVFIIGNVESDTFYPKDFPSQRAMLLNLIKYAPNAEEIIFHRAARMARTEKGMKNISKINFPTFNKYELFGELLKIVIEAYETHSDVKEYICAFLTKYGKHGSVAYNMFTNEKYYSSSFLPKLEAIS
ncbi:MAG: glycosyltransferase family 2 protein [Gilliamella sp.]|uniref:glycosyltransferase family 2 protein n=1 Tax=Gilliamella sp. TaxID=1891236 RepID=UPI0025F8BFD9|nr:glycosyltransferase family 2 protein [Gilliamella sp.]MCO6540363.1 glycosyltransferase family 2 protein [Gilliamella sp.]